TRLRQRPAGAGPDPQALHRSQCLAPAGQPRPEHRPPTPTRARAVGGQPQMNLLQLVLKQMRQRALSTWLTMLSIVLGVGLGSAVMILQRGAGKLFGQTDYGYDVLVGAKGSPLQLTLNTVYQLDKSPGNIPYSLYEQMMRERKYQSMIKIAVPTAA